MNFEKPTQRPEPPVMQNPFMKLTNYKKQTACIFDIVWVFMRSIPHIPIPNIESVTEQVIPFWTGYNHLPSQKHAEVTATAYLPVIEAKSSDMVTVYTCMKHNK